MARRILNRKELRADFDAAERRKGGEGEEAEETEEEVEDDIEDEEEGEAAEGGEEEASDEEGGDEEEGGEDDEDAPKKKKKKKVVKPVKPKAKPRTRTPKVTRMKVMWSVYNNSNQRVATYDYPKRKEAEEHAAKLTADKKNTHFVQPEKVAMEEKKEKE
jgi:hypothetical protein